MIEPAAVVDHLEQLGVRFHTGVPDSLLKEFGTHVMAHLPRDRHVIAANEGGAVAIAMGHHLRTGQVPLVYLQNSGFGNLVNPLLSLADRDVYGIPMVVLIGWRGQPGVKDEPQHVTQGRLMADLCDAMDLPWAVLPQGDADAAEALTTAVRTATERGTPYLLLVEKGTFAPAVDPSAATSDGAAGDGAAGDEAVRSGASVSDDTAMQPDEAEQVLPSREEALVAVVEAIGDGPVLVSTTGMLSRELFEHRERSGTDASRDVLTVGGMGHASSIALGIAMEEPDREVWCLDGDGALLMHLGGLAVIADHAPDRYHHVVFNNGVHDSVGGQPTSIAVVDVPAVAAGLGYRAAARTSDLEAIPGLLAEHRAVGGPTLLEVQVRPGNRPGIGRPTRTPAEAKAAFMAAVR